MIHIAVSCPESKRAIKTAAMVEIWATRHFQTATSGRASRIVRENYFFRFTESVSLGIEHPKRYLMHAWREVQQSTGNWSYLVGSIRGYVVDSEAISPRQRGDLASNGLK